jgi:very-short-patch-repair endonuclease
MTPAEAVFWRIVKNSNLDGRKFRRQHSVGRYVLDFYCPSEKLGIELDGEGHYYALQHILDMERDRFVRHFGIKVLRFENRAVFEETVWMIDQIRAAFGWKSRRPEVPTVLDRDVEYFQLSKNHPVRRSGVHPSFVRRGVVYSPRST